MCKNDGNIPMSPGKTKTHIDTLVTTPTSTSRGSAISSSTLHPTTECLQTEALAKRRRKTKIDSTGRDRVISPRSITGVARPASCHHLSVDDPASFDVLAAGPTAARVQHDLSFQRYIDLSTYVTAQTYHRFRWSRTNPWGTLTSARFAI